MERYRERGGKKRCDELGAKWRGKGRAGPGHPPAAAPGGRGRCARGRRRAGGRRHGKRERISRGTIARRLTLLGGSLDVLGHLEHPSRARPEVDGPRGRRARRWKENQGGRKRERQRDEVSGGLIGFGGAGHGTESTTTRPKRHDTTSHSPPTSGTSALERSRAVDGPSHSQAGDKGEESRVGGGSRGEGR